MPIVVSIWELESFSAKLAASRPAVDELRQQMLTECDSDVAGLVHSGACITCGLHDSVPFENDGNPTVIIATDVLAEAAEAQFRAGIALGWQRRRKQRGVKVSVRR